MRARLCFSIAFGCGLVIWLGNTSSIATEKTPAKKSSSEAPSCALIVVEGVHTKDRIGQFRAISILDPKKLAKLETFFPNYRKLPASDIAAGWEMRYRVYFEFPEGKAIHLSVSAGKEASWSIGRGDFDVVGNFDEFVKALEK